MYETFGWPTVKLKLSGHLGLELFLITNIDISLRAHLTPCRMGCLRYFCGMKAIVAWT